MKENYRQIIGMNIKQVRKAKKMTIEQLAFSAEVSKTGLCYIERGVSDPRLSTLEKIAEGLNIELLALLEHKSSKK